MARAWPEFAARLRDLDAATAAWPVAPPAESVFAPGADGIPVDVVSAATVIPDRSFVLWDAARLRAHVAWVRGVLATNGVGLSVGLKACATEAILSMLSGMGLYADAQSPGECALATRTGFTTVTATGPGFTPAAMKDAIDAGVLLDAQSSNQLEQLRALGVTQPIGVRARVRLPEWLAHPAMHGTTSRFGLTLDRDGFEQMTGHGAQISRVRVHTGEALSTDVAYTLEYRARLGCLLRESLCGIEEINLGGGFIALARDPPALAAAFAAVGQVLDDDAKASGVRARCWVEPGSALLLDSAYLITEVVDVCSDRHAVTVDASPWNIAPWAFPAVYVLGNEVWPYTGDVYGPALYENDRLRRTARYTPAGRTPKVGDRLIITAFGSYTLVHGRTFGQIPLPGQYVFDGDTHWAAR